MIKERVKAFIFARGGSKGVPGKNLRMVGGYSLLTHAIQAATASKYIENITVSTDSEEVAAVAELWGARVLARPEHLSQGEAGSEWRAWQHALGTLKLDPYDIFVSVPCTCPLRKPEQIDACIEELERSRADVCLTITEARPNPYYTTVIKKEHEVHRPFGTVVGNRQAAPPAYNVVGVCYAAKPEFILKSNGIWDGAVTAVEVPQESALDIDTEFDLKIAQALMR